MNTDTAATNATMPPRLSELYRDQPPPNYTLMWTGVSLYAFLASGSLVVLMLFVAPEPPDSLNFFQLVSYSPLHFAALGVLVTVFLVLVTVFLVLLWGMLRQQRYEVRIMNAYCDRLDLFSSEQLREWECQLSSEIDPNQNSVASKEVAAIWMVLDHRGDPAAIG